MTPALPPWDILDALVAAWPVLVAVVTVLLAALGTAHVLLNKAHARAAVAWVGLLWLSPVVGAVAYAVLGVNRIERKAARLRQEAPPPHPPLPSHTVRAPGPPHLARLAGAVERVSGRPLTGGNAITPLHDGDEAYPAMLAAIDAAERTVALQTYIFDVHRWGSRFVDALVRARERGVDVKVLVDGIGMLYGWPNAVRTLRKRGVDARAFLFSLRPSRMAYLNLRNHRKILVVDGHTGFAGGMNLRDGHVLGDAPDHPTADLHFRLQGPVVRQLQEIFAVDWAFTTHEVLDGPEWFPPLSAAGDVYARAVPDGPDEDRDVARWTLAAGVASARDAVRIVTPYFLPDDELVGVLVTAALRGVTVDVVLPPDNNLPYVAWATNAALPALLRHGVRVWQSSGPFDHTKLVVVDRAWVLFGSANVDPRSLRLNFELLVEAYDTELGARADDDVARRLADATPITLETLAARPLLHKLRDGAARLLEPYL